jgi:hypothetical protein
MPKPEIKKTFKVVAYYDDISPDFEEGPFETEGEAAQMRDEIAKDYTFGSVRIVPCFDSVFNEEKKSEDVNIKEIVNDYEDMYDK